MLKEMKKLIHELNLASEQYYNTGTSPISDTEYDLLYSKLQEMENITGTILSNSPTHRVGAPVLKDMKKIDISNKPMLSLNKCHTAKEIKDFANGKDLVASIKCDGLSVRIIYKNGKLLSANTRGDGEIGQDITEHIKHFINVPLTLPHNKDLIVDGEAVILQQDFDEINTDSRFKNPRNLAAGTLACLDTSLCTSRRLSFIAWDVIEFGGENFSYYNKLKWLLNWGFRIVPMIEMSLTELSQFKEDDYDKVNEQLIEKAAELGIPCDGVVWKFNNIEYGDSLGRTAKFFNNAIAWKPSITEVETELVGIEWTMGRTAVLTPIAIYKDIELLGSTCNRASLHNLSIMNEILGTHPYVGQKINVFKANEIIPQISYADKENINYDKLIKLITKCPICGGDIEIKDNNGVLTVWCTNPACDGKLTNKIDHYCSKKGLDIKGLSLATIEKLVDWGWLGNTRELYSLENFKADWINKSGFGQASVTKILSAIEESKNCNLESFISALGIPLIGRTVSKEIVKYYDTWDAFREAVGGRWSDLDGFGPEMEYSLNHFDYKEADEIAALLTFKQPKTQSDVVLHATSAVFCITGKLNNYKNRDELKSYIESIGGKVVGSMSSKVNYLINNDNKSTSAKNIAAQKAGIPIITEAEFLATFGQN